MRLPARSTTAALSKSMCAFLVKPVLRQSRVISLPRARSNFVPSHDRDLYYLASTMGRALNNLQVHQMRMTFSQ